MKSKPYEVIRQLTDKFYWLTGRYRVGERKLDGEGDLMLEMIQE